MVADWPSNYLSIEVIHARIERAFSDVGILACEYTLADGDFMDDWRWYPDTCHFYSDGYELQAKYFREVWPEKSYRVAGVKEALESQVRRELPSYKSVHWSDESAEYVRAFSGAFCFLNSFSSAHYFAAWMSLDLRGLYELNHCGSSTQFFEELISNGPCLAKVIREFDDSKKSAIADFLIFSAQDALNSDLSRLESKVTARLALEIEYLEYASEPLKNQYLEWMEVRSLEEGEDKVIHWVESNYQRTMKFWSDRC